MGLSDRMDLDLYKALELDMNLSLFGVLGLSHSSEPDMEDLGLWKMYDFLFPI